MRRTYNSRAKVADLRDDGYRAGSSMRPPPRPTSTIAETDAETHHIFPEESWFGLEFRNRAAWWEADWSGPDTHTTGAFTVWGPETVDLSEESRPYATDTSRLDNNIAKEEERQARAMSKSNQLMRHGLVVGDHDHLKPLLALSNVSHKKQERRKQTAQRLVDQYIYESSEDDAIASQPLTNLGKKSKKGRLMKLKEALAKLEMPSGASQAGQHVPITKSGIGNLRASSRDVTDEENESLPTLGFQKAMQNLSHPDFGMDFTAALGLAMAKEKKAHVLAMPDRGWGSDDEDSGAAVSAAPGRNTNVRFGAATRVPLARLRPQSRPQSFSRAEMNGQRKYDIVEYTVAKASEMGGLDFRDERLVDIFNGIMQRDNPRRPIRSRASLLAISYTDPVEYFGQGPADIAGERGIQ